MEVQKGFKNVFSYAAGVEKWVKDAYKSVSDKKMQYTFPADFAIADWYGKKELEETYERIKKEWLSNYKAFTEVAVSLVYLGYANDMLVKQGFEDREKYINLYYDMYYKAQEDFYAKYGENDEACRWFFEWTD